MGCVFGKEASSPGPSGGDFGRDRVGGEDLSRKGEKAVDGSVNKAEGGGGGGGGATAGEVQNGGDNNKNEVKDERVKPSRKEKRKARLNPRLSNPPKHVEGEQVAAGWPPWLVAVAGEALSGWVPRRADTFEKLDKVKCYVHQLLSGLEHCHNRHVLHRDIKGSNLLIDDDGVLKIADFGLATIFDPNNKQPMTSRVVTLWYRPPELLLGATDYGVGVDLWSAGCILAELFAGKPIMAGRTEVEQLHKIFKLCGSPSDEYWKKSKLPHATIFKPQQAYKRRIKDVFKDFPQSSLPLIDTLLAIDPAERQTATVALRSEFFTTKPYACEPSSLPKYPPSKEMDAKRRDEEARRLKTAGKTHAASSKKTRVREQASRAMPAPEANAELRANIDRRRLINHANAKSKSEKFPPPHQDGGLGYTMGPSHHIDPTFDPPDVPFSTMNFSYAKEPIETWSGPLADPTGVGAPRRKLKPSKNKGSVLNTRE
ncbi:probable serine/threonine-protein kinase At1g54610 isoform X2 [Andrographis paniculata]|uniref:probable serine/threonine-protein kinase At1g54610 isoform X2 n=1 Tax=Andrographis paniculata TaxID=175694 RepID=UPI0021E94A48|nr:probable serine/threonine-protein kinase At1g54610 isoform X2 [Andrographis paniculata]